MTINNPANVRGVISLPIEINHIFNYFRSDTSLIDPPSVVVNNSTSSLFPSCR